MRVKCGMKCRANENGYCKRPEEEWVCCPYCGQKIKFGEIPKAELIDITLNECTLNDRIKIHK